MPIFPETRSALVLREKTFLSLRNLIYEASGLFFDQLNRQTFEQRLRLRVEALRFDSFERYYLYLCYADHDGEELQRAIDALAVHETYFFREKRALQAFGQEILPLLERSNSDLRSLRIWSAGCSTGEEAYTLAMLVLESGLFVDWDVKIIGSDISPRVIAKATLGRYPRTAFRTMERRLRARYFKRQADGSWQVIPELRRMVTFNRVNLIAEGSDESLGDFDVIFCRNVLIYFDQRARQRAISTLHRALRDGGYLVLGAAESLMASDTPFKLVRLQNDFVYQK
jgi:chemotaxis protein methyltransferase CheR